MKRYLQRKIGIREVRQRILAVCEGKSTEKKYLQSFRVTSASVKTIGKGKNTIDLIQKTIRIRGHYLNNGTDFDQVWCVFDKDSFLNKDFDDAFVNARKNGIYVAYLNPCFELWYLLHFENVNSQLSFKQIKKKLEKHLGKKYKKNDKTMYESILHLQDHAIERAKKLDRFTSRTPYSQRNPCTTVYKLVTELNKYTS